MWLCFEATRSLTLCWIWSYSNANNSGVSYLFVNWHVDGDKLSYSIVVLHNPISNPYLSLLYVKDHLYYRRCVTSGLSKEPHIMFIPILLSAFPSLWQMVSWSLPEKLFKSLFRPFGGFSDFSDLFARPARPFCWPVSLVSCDPCDEGGEKNGEWGQTTKITLKRRQQKKGGKATDAGITLFQVGRIALVPTWEVKKYEDCGKRGNLPVCHRETMKKMHNKFLGQVCVLTLLFLVCFLEA